VPIEAFDLTEPELTAEDRLVPEGPQFGPETVAVVTGVRSGTGRATVPALATNGRTVIESMSEGTVERDDPLRDGVDTTTDE